MHSEIDSCNFVQKYDSRERCGHSFTIECYDVQKHSNMLDYFKEINKGAVGVEDIGRSTFITLVMIDIVAKKLASYIIFEPIESDNSIVLIYISGSTTSVEYGIRDLSTFIRYVCFKCFEYDEKVRYFGSFTMSDISRHILVNKFSFEDISIANDSSRNLALFFSDMFDGVDLTVYTEKTNIKFIEKMKQFDDIFNNCKFKFQISIKMNGGSIKNTFRMRNVY